MSIDKCLPEPRRPDILTYILILSQFAVLYIMCFMEAYVLRTRRTIMASQYPERERARVLYLRTKIISGRGVTTAFAEHVRDAFHKIETADKEKKHSMLENLAHRKGVGLCAKITNIYTKL